MSINIIAACDNNGLIGVNGTLPWHIPEDLQRFKMLTTGHTVIMGRKTWESIGSKPLPKRKNIIVSSSLSIWAKPGRYKAAVTLGGAILCAGTPDEIFIIGGERIFKEALSIADRAYITIIDKEIKVTKDAAYFPLPELERTFEFVDADLRKGYRFEIWRKRI